MKAVVALLLGLAAICFGIAALVNWFQHDDHAALGFQYLAGISAMSCGIFARRV